MLDREKVIKDLTVRIQSDSEEWNTVELPIKQAEDILSLLKEQTEIKEKFIEAFNTIRDAYNTPTNREKILLNYLLRNGCCCADGERR